MYLQPNAPAPQPGLVNFVFLEMRIYVLIKVGIEPALEKASWKLEIQNALLAGIADYGDTVSISGYKKTAPVWMRFCSL